jgi:NAD(P)-dependent dehydrogenase (short-subunit alcohol dehydrogenase family)
MSEEIHAGRVAIVTGGASGIGRATARQLAAEGARVCVADLNLAAAQAVVKEITEAGGEAIARAMDTSDVEANEAVVREPVDHFGGLHLAHLNAGIAEASSVLGGDVAVWDRVLAVNLRGVYLGMRSAGGAMVKSGGGAIVATASVAGLQGGNMMPSYYASKHGVVGLVKSAAAELAPHGIRVNCVCPGVIDTPLLGPAHGVEAVTSMLAKGHLLNRVGAADEVAQLVSFLLSERAGFITGGAYPVDGGMTATIGGTVGEMDEDQQQAFENFMDGLPGDE